MFENYILIYYFILSIAVSIKVKSKSIILATCFISFFVNVFLNLLISFRFINLVITLFIGDIEVNNRITVMSHRSFMRL